MQHHRSTNETSRLNYCNIVNVACNITDQQNETLKLKYFSISKLFVQHPMLKNK